MALGARITRLELFSTTFSSSIALDDLSVLEAVARARNRGTPLRSSPRLPWVALVPLAEKNSTSVAALKVYVANFISEISYISKEFPLKIYQGCGRIEFAPSETAKISALTALRII